MDEILPRISFKFAILFYIVVGDWLLAGSFRALCTISQKPSTKS